MPAGMGPAPLAPVPALAAPNLRLHQATENGLIRREQRRRPADGLAQQLLQMLALLRLQQRHGLDDAAVRAKGPVVALAAVDPITAVGRLRPEQRPKLVALDRNLQLPAAGQIEPHPPPPDLTPGPIRKEGLSRQQRPQGLLDLGGAATAQGVQSG